MGYIRHNAIVVTTWNDDHIQAARAKAIELELPVSEIVESWMNGYQSFLIAPERYRSFLIAPDGSKEGWAESTKGENARAAWITWARKSKLYLDWVHVDYGGDDRERCEIMDCEIMDYKGKLDEDQEE